ncbi:MAG TPA: (2Fe-2S) ferredoxin domain-containing protein [Thermoanaerobaculia bacterium]|nr:(2Fe-2S) ferredoxin domain-containing protein [Thermoanaerobaculia bacterium]
MAVPRVQILVCTNERGADAERPSCAPRGGLEVYRRFKDAVRREGLRDEVIVTRTGCLRHCSFGVTVGVWPDNRWYGGVTPDDVEEILASSVAGDGRVVERLALPPDAPFE